MSVMKFEDLEQKKIAGTRAAVKKEIDGKEAIKGAWVAGGFHEEREIKAGIRGLFAGIRGLFAIQKNGLLRYI